ncbi:hypothetical protein BDR07DRAFT_358224 [Suillus spraguei]|nr:hypothetical protein BDR07DRAFT_358224 [Suillus spraguei]
MIASIGYRNSTNSCWGGPGLWWWCYEFVWSMVTQLGIPPHLPHPRFLYLPFLPSFLPPSYSLFSQLESKFRTMVPYSRTSLASRTMPAHSHLSKQQKKARSTCIGRRHRAVLVRHCYPKARMQMSQSRTARTHVQYLGKISEYTKLPDHVTPSPSLISHHRPIHSRLLYSLPA